ALLRSGGIPPERCPECGEPLTFEDVGYFRFVSHCGATGIDPAAATLLEEQGLFSTKSGPQRRLEVSKLVEDHVTVLQLAGDLDERFRPRRFGTGLEGAVVLVAGQLTLQRNGRKMWDEFIQLLDQQCSEIVITDLPGPVVEQFEGQKIQLGRAVVHS